MYNRRQLRMLEATNISEYMQFAKYNGTPKFVDFTVFGNRAKPKKYEVLLPSRIKPIAIEGKI